VSFLRIWSDTLVLRILLMFCFLLGARRRQFGMMMVVGFVVLLKCLVYILVKENGCFCSVGICLLVPAFTCEYDI
jgi:hypothetical protein